MTDAQFKQGIDDFIAHRSGATVRDRKPGGVVSREFQRALAAEGGPDNPSCTKSPVNYFDDALVELRAAPQRSFAMEAFVTTPRYLVRERTDEDDRKDAAEVLKNMEDIVEQARINRSPDYPVVRLWLSIAYIAGEDYDKAETILKSILARSEPTVEPFARSVLGDAFAEDDNDSTSASEREYKEAIILFKRLKTGFPQYTRDSAAYVDLQLADLTGIIGHFLSSPIVGPVVEGRVHNHGRAHAVCDVQNN